MNTTETKPRKLHYIMADGGEICLNCVVEVSNPVVFSFPGWTDIVKREFDDPQWTVIGVQDESDETMCANCNRAF